MSRIILRRRSPTHYHSRTKAEDHRRQARPGAGFEVVYTGIRQTPEMIAETALQEDADLIGLSILSGAHLELFPRVVEGVKKRGMDDVGLFAGGIIPQEDIA